MMMISILTLISVIALSEALEVKSLEFDEKMKISVDKNCTHETKRKECPNDLQQVMDCYELLLKGYNESGPYLIYPQSRLAGFRAVEVYCDMDTDGGGWTVIQRRGDYKRPLEYFFKGWEEYKVGFGDITKDFWLGNDNIFMLTNQKLYSVRFDLQDFNGTRKHALYDEFWIDGEHCNYTLHIKDYSGYAGDAMQYHNNMQFSTKDRKNDKSPGSNCATLRKGGWWYNNCFQANLNSLIQTGKNENSTVMAWKPWTGTEHSLKYAEIKIRPKTKIIKSGKNV